MLDLSSTSQNANAVIKRPGANVRIESPIGRVTHLPKRELFDVRVQLLNEGGANDDIIDQIDKADLRAGVYEGGFKTWECSLDLASLLLDRGPRKDIDELIRCDQVIEVSLRFQVSSVQMD